MLSSYKWIWLPELTRWPGGEPVQSTRAQWSGGGLGLSPNRCHLPCLNAARLAVPSLFLCLSLAVDSLMEEKDWGVMHRTW